MAPVSSAGAPAARVRAPDLVGRAWLNTGAAALTSQDLRGRVVLLDFWTFCCVNCLHVLDELRPLEREFGDSLLVIGVHSPKFAHEADPDALAAAVARYDVAHPVLDDPELQTWSRYAVRAWPTLVVIDPEGYIAGQFSGEGHAHAIRALVARLVREHQARGTLRRGAGPYVPPDPAPGPLRFPGKAVALPDGTLLVSDTGSHTLAVLRPGAEEPLLRVGKAGERGLVDGSPDVARFAEPGGITILPAAVAGDVGYDLVVADTANHALRGVSTIDWSVRTVAGTGTQWMRGDPTAGAGTTVPLSSPWDCAWWDGRVAVAMAGIHQLWTLDPRTGEVSVLAGTTQEGLVDGEAASAWFAQPSGLAVDGETLWLVDAETSALRRLRNGLVHTEVGAGLFDFGHVDGPGAEALLQHPTGVGVLPDGSVAVCDTYNGALRRFDPASGLVSTMATDLGEPTAVVVEPDGQHVTVVESTRHRLTRLPVPEVVRRLAGRRHRTPRPPTDTVAGPVRLEVVFAPPPGQELDDRYGPATYLAVSATPPGLLLSGEGTGTSLRRGLVLADPAVSGITEGVLHVSARAASCDHGTPFPACHVHQQDWGVPVRLAEEGAAEITLVLGVSTSREGHTA
jgi:thiol-disulfide isomerase/thioredoxin